MEAGAREAELEGGCACGAIRFRVQSRLDEVGYCHCRLCQRASGAPVMVWATAPLDRVAWSSTPMHRRSSSFGERWFCGACGTQLAMRVDHEPTTIDIAVVSLDEPTHVAPTFHIWDASRIAWLAIADECPRFAGARRE